MATAREQLYVLSIHDLLNLSEKDPLEIVETLKTDLKSFQESLNNCHKVRSTSKSTYIAAVIHILNKVCQVTSHESANIIIAEFLSERCSQFHALLKEYVLKIGYTSSEIESAETCMLFKSVLARQPTSAWHVLPIDDLISASIGLHNRHSLEQLRAQRDRICDDIKQQKILEQKYKIQRQKEIQKEHFKNWDNSQYRKISILPTISEVCSHKVPLLRPNLINSCYDSWEHYYDVQFRLLREDFLAPLRRGIHSYVSGARGKQLHDIIIYRDVCLVRPEFTRQGTCFRIRLNTQCMRKGWEQSKKLIFGSLLCFSNDDFKHSIYFATVIKRDIEDMQKHGEIIVKFECNVEMLAHCRSTHFIVAESRAYYEASSHILRSLQLAETDTMPFVNYFIKNDCSKVNPPAYLSDSSKAKSLHDLELVHNPIDLQSDSWLIQNLVQLDESQLNAVKMALTQEISVIQGPPGTGKTYIGYKIVHTLLQNRKVWDPHNSSPILVMCLTNHALDQFLEGLLDSNRVDINDDIQQIYKPRIVRVGGQSESQRIQELNINKIRGWVPSELLDKRQYLIKQIESSVKKMPWRSLYMSVHYTVDEYIVGPNGVPRLEKVIDPTHFYQLSTLACNSEEKGHILEMWLGMWEDTNKSNTLELRKEFLPPKLQHPSSLHEPETIAIEGEGVTESQSRIIDDDTFAIIKTMDDDDDSPQAPQIQSHKRKRKNHSEIKRIIQLIKSSRPLEKNEVILIKDVTSLTLDRKYKLLLHWIKQYQEQLKQLNDNKFTRYNGLCKQLKETQQQIDRYALEKAEVIGMTTTGAAKYQHIIHIVKPKIVIVEEAAEVTESHIVSALSASTEHLILIGDHKQLRPKINEYDLAMKYNLHISLFERLIKSGLPHATLLQQHRMRPEIARLVHPHIYDKLENHKTVKHYDNIIGFKKNMYFFHHEHEEEEDDTSHSNTFEAEFAAALCKHILNQGYKPSEITILTPYIGQLFKLKAYMPKSDYEGVKVTCVDNFQGEENNIIILSLVRSNKLGSVGFLKEDNRVCVSLSRAKKGLYCFGNFKILRQSSPLWESILADLEKVGCLGSSFELFCHNHPSYQCLIHHHNEISTLFPNGGCQSMCVHRLSCGHSCKLHCHPDPDHSKYKCMEYCTRTCSEGHSCTKRCYEDWQLCKRLVTRELPCKHIKKLLCYQNPEKANCFEQCKKLCSRGHQCKLYCSESCGPCQEEIATKLPTCGHTQMLRCSIDPSDHLCTENVSKVLHVCCHVQIMHCHQTPYHRLCSKPCLKKLHCGHTCQRQCGENCKCNEKIQVQLSCGHQYTKLCGETSVVKCTEIIEVMCPKNHVYQRKCSDSNGACDKICGQLLECGHKCINKCSEKCGPCSATVTKRCPYQHSYKFKCSGTSKSSESQCSENCTSNLQCGHKCTGKCGECYNRRIHRPCPYKLDLKTICGHSKTSPCIGLQSPCIKKCSLVACSHHKQCQHRCWKECQERCKEHCIVQCRHGKCLKPCDVPCQKLACNEYCDKLLVCGHGCPGLCGETCLTSCIICNREIFQMITSKYGSGSKTVKLEENRYIQLDCAHIFPVEYMDNYVYKSVASSAITPLQCPIATCHTPLTSRRYWKAVKERVLEIKEIKKSLKIADSTIRDRFDVLIRAAHNLNISLDKIMFRPYATSRLRIGLPETTETACCLDMIEFANNVSEMIDLNLSDLNELRQLLVMHIVSFKGALSHQLVSDITSELYRIVITHLVHIVQSKLLSQASIDMRVLRKFDEVKNVLDEMDGDHSIRITGDKYHSLYSDLQNIFKVVCPSHSMNCNISHAITHPKATKGEWHKCAYGHIYFVPATFTRKNFQCNVCHSQIN